MKKLGLIALLLLVSGCSKVDEIINNDTTADPVVEETKDTTGKTLVCKNEEGGSVTFKAKGDQIQSMKQTSFITYEQLGIDPNSVNKDVIQERINQAITEKYQGITGIGVVGQMVEDKIEIIVEIDYTIADKQALIDAGLLDEGEKDNEYISLNKTQEVYKQTYACEFE